MNELLENLGAEVARIQDEGLVDDRRRAFVRRQLLAQPTSARRHTRSHAWRPVFALVGAGVAALAILMLWPAAPEAIAYQVDDGAESSQVDHWITAPDTRPLPVRFTDGSSVRLAPGARARIHELTPAGALLELERGAAAVHVKHRRETRWTVRAGPFLVRVTGTRFHVGWNPSDRSFELEVFDGEVRVSGPDMPERIVRSGGEVHIAPQPEMAPEPPDPISEPTPVTATPTHPVRRARKAAVEQSAPPPRPPAPALELALPPKQPDAPREGSVTPEPPDTAASQERSVASESNAPTSLPGAHTPPSEPAWRILIDRGQYAKALSDLDPEEIEQAIWQSDPDDLINLGAAARRLGDRRAGYIYSVLRSRFAGTDAAADAAFMLARMQFHAGAPQGAVTWLNTYLRERPNGRFAREAAGRLVEAYHQSADQSRAKAAAERYLARYPDGPHAALARSVLE